MRGSEARAQQDPPPSALGPWRGNAATPCRVGARPEFSRTCRGDGPPGGLLSVSAGDVAFLAGAASSECSFTAGPWRAWIWIWPSSKCVIHHIKSAGGQRNDQLPESLGSCPRAQYAERLGALSSLCAPAWLGGCWPSLQEGPPASVSPSVSRDSGSVRGGQKARVPQILVKGPRAGLQREGPVQVSVCCWLPGLPASPVPGKGPSCRWPQR